MASLTIGVCLGSILGVGLAMLSTKWLYLMEQTVNSHYLSVYYGAFFIAIAYSFIRGAAQAAIHLLQLVALTCLLIPMSSLLTFLLPEVGLWTPKGLSAVTLELMAMIFAVLFFYSAKKAKHRAYYGERNSIWALIPPSLNTELSQEIDGSKAHYS